MKSKEAETVRGVRVTVSGTCQVKVDAFVHGKHGDLRKNLPQITLACQHFLGKVSPTVIVKYAVPVPACICFTTLLAFTHHYFDASGERSLRRSLEKA